jgi:hypothetical protein
MLLRKSAVLGRCANFSLNELNDDSPDAIRAELARFECRMFFFNSRDDVRLFPLTDVLVIALPPIRLGSGRRFSVAKRPAVRAGRCQRSSGPARFVSSPS